MIDRVELLWKGGGRGEEMEGGRGNEVELGGLSFGFRDFEDPCRFLHDDRPLLHEGNFNQSKVSTSFLKENLLKEARLQRCARNKLLVLTFALRPTSSIPSASPPLSSSYERDVIPMSSSDLPTGRPCLNPPPARVKSLQCTARLGLSSPPPALS